MIGYLEGEVLASDTKTLTLKVGSVGYRLFTTHEIIQNVKDKKETIALWTHLAVRENSQDLFGFTLKEERDFFELLITIPGVGPKSALAVLNAVPTQTLISAISQNDVSYLTKVSGIGKKTADKIVLELRDKIGAVSEGSFLDEENDVLDALKSLGYREREIRETLKKIPESISGAGERIKEALKLLGGK